MRAAATSRSKMTDYQVEKLAHRMCMTYRHVTPDGPTYTFNMSTLLDFAKALLDGKTIHLPSEDTEGGDF